MKKLLLLAIVCISLTGIAQDLVKTQDFGLWTRAEFEYKLQKPFKLFISQGVRLGEGLSQVDKVNTNIGISHKVNKHYKLALNARYSFFKKADFTPTEKLRYNFDLKYKRKFGKRFYLQYRGRFQTEYEEIFGKVQGGITSNFRNRLKLGLRFDDHKVYLKTEIFRELNRYSDPYYNKFRIGIGDAYKTKLGDLNISLNYQKELNEVAPLSLVFVSTYFTFKAKQKDKDDE